MDFLKGLSGGQEKAPQGASAPTTEQSGGFMGKVNEAMGGGHKGEQGEGMPPTTLTIDQCLPVI